MADSETQAATERVRDRQSWIIGWFVCAVVSLLVLFRIVLDWHSRDSAQRVLACAFVAFLVLFPARLHSLRKKRSFISIGWVFTIAYVMLMLAMETFGHLNH